MPAAPDRIAKYVMDLIFSEISDALIAALVAI
jgi:hypothetical protein